jgi:hypothetical protein
MASQKVNGKSGCIVISRLSLNPFSSYQRQPCFFFFLFFFFHNKLQYMHTHRCREQLGKTAQLVAGLSQLFTYFHSAVSE